MRTVLLALALAASPFAARADWSGDISMTHNGQPSPIKGTLSGKGHLMRFETTQPAPTAVIIDHEAKKLVRLDEAHKTYSESDLRQQANDASRFPECGTGNIDQCLTEQGYKKTGSAEANGHPTSVWERDVEGPGGKLHQKLYRPTDLKEVPFVRIDGTGPFGANEMNLTNVSTASQPAARFQVPAGYTKTEAPAMGAGMRGNMTPEQMEQLKKQYMQQMQRDAAQKNAHP